MCMSKNNIDKLTPCRIGFEDSIVDFLNIIFQKIEALEAVYFERFLFLNIKPYQKGKVAGKCLKMRLRGWGGSDEFYKALYPMFKIQSLI